MADPTYSAKAYFRQGADGLVIASGGVIKVETGGQIVPNSGTQASAITAPAATASTNTTPYGFSTAAQADALVTSVRSILTALQGVGIIP